jgi:hypothetical protein
MPFSGTPNALLLLFLAPGGTTPRPVENEYCRARDLRFCHSSDFEVRVFRRRYAHVHDSGRYLSLEPQLFSVTIINAQHPCLGSCRSDPERATLLSRNTQRLACPKTHEMACSPAKRSLNPSVTTCWNECFQDGLPQQRGWEQALGQNEVVKRLLVEALA